MKSLEFIYQDTQIHFLLQNEGEVMVNATEMAKLFGKRTDVFLKTDHVKSFLDVLKLTPNGGSLPSISEDNLIQRKGRSGVYFNRILALKFAAWLDPQFEIWIYRHIDEVLFGNYKKHWDAHQVQEKAKDKMETLKQKLVTNATTEMAIEYFETKNECDVAGNVKRKALRDQMKFEFPE